MENKSHSPATPEHPQPKVLRPKNFFGPWATQLLYKHILADPYSHMKATH